MMMKTTLITSGIGLSASLILLLSFAGRVEAALENFDGYSSSTSGQNGGSSSGGISWTGAWGEGAIGGSAAIIQSQMGTVNGVASSSPYAEKQMNTAKAEATRAFTSQGDVSVLYVYFLISRGGSDANGYGGVGLYAAGNEKFLIGQRFQVSTWGATGLGGGSSGNDSAVALGNFSTTLLLAKINQQANTLDFYVNPNFTQTEAQNSAAFTISYGTGDDTIDSIRLRGGNANSGVTWQWDNLNVTTASPFAPVPEPVNLALVGFAVLASARLLFRRFVRYRQSFGERSNSGASRNIPMASSQTFSKGPGRDRHVCGACSSAGALPAPIYLPAVCG